MITIKIEVEIEPIDDGDYFSWYNNRAIVLTESDKAKALRAMYEVKRDTEAERKMDEMEVRNERC